MTNDAPDPSGPSVESRQAQRALVIIGVVILLITVGLMLIAVALASNAPTAAPAVRVVRDLLIIVVTLEVIVIGAAVTVFLVQVARLVNLVSNELTPLITATSDTVNTVRGTALFLSKNLVEPVIAMNSALRGLAKVAGDVDAIRKAAGIVMEAANATSPTSTHSAPSARPDREEPPAAEADNAPEMGARKKVSRRRKSSRKTSKEE